MSTMSTTDRLISMGKANWPGHSAAFITTAHDVIQSALSPWRMGEMYWQVCVGHSQKWCRREFAGQ